jgi:hypothetical protein
LGVGGEGILAGRCCDRRRGCDLRWRGRRQASVLPGNEARSFVGFGWSEDEALQAANKSKADHEAATSETCVERSHPKVYKIGPLGQFKAELFTECISG